MEASGRQTVQSSPVFRLACRLAHVIPSREQAAKWLRGRGAAIIFRHQAALQLGIALDKERSVSLN